MGAAALRQSQEWSMESLIFAFVVFCKGSGVFRNPKCECLYHFVRTYTLTEADTFMDVCFLWEYVMLAAHPPRDPFGGDVQCL